MLLFRYWILCTLGRQTLTKKIESFLQVANDLQIKGLIEKNTPRKTSTKEGELISPQD